MILIHWPSLASPHLFQYQILVGRVVHFSELLTVHLRPGSRSSSGLVALYSLSLPRISSAGAFQDLFKAVLAVGVCLL